MDDRMQRAMSKVPAVTLGFWIIKILATTLGETGGDTVTMTLDWGYLAGTVLFAVVLVVLVIAQILSRRFNPALYWATIVASTTFGTTMADFADRSLGIGYTGGSSLLLACLAGVLGSGTPPRARYRSIRFRRRVLRRSTGRPSPFRRHWARRLAIGWRYGWARLRRRRAGLRCGLSGGGGAVLPHTNLAGWPVLGGLHPDASLGATVGDFLDKPVANGGLNLSRPIASAVIAAFIVALIVLLPQRPGQHPGSQPANP